MNTVVTFAEFSLVEGEDFSGMDPVVATFPAGVTTSGDLACVNITILEDMVLEGQHSFVVQIAHVSPDEANIIAPSIADVIIGDNDGEFVHTQ